MKSLSILLIVSVLSLSGCARMNSERAANRPLESSETRGSSEQKLLDQASKQAQTQSVAFNQAEKSIPLEAAIDRKIIRDADLTIEVASTIEAQQKVTGIAESYGGYVVTTEAKQREHSDPARRTVDVKLVVRVPSNQFNAALGQIENLATNLPQRNISSQDVSEEFIDLEARIKTQKALELQFLEIMKQASEVADALEVQRQLAEVRTDIEKIEGRKRFLENRSSMSTITVNIRTPTPIVVSASSFGHTVHEAVSESVELASGIALFFVRFVIVMAPVFVFVILPAGVVALYFRRRAKRIRLAAALEANPAVD
jgi:hypothetical protein